MKCFRPWYSKKNKSALPCGKCAFCVKKQIDAWCLRLRHELEVSYSALFITLTYDDANLPLGPDDVPTLSKRDLNLFLKRLYKRNSGLRYFAVGEYGTDGKRPHYHAVLFNIVDMEMVHRSWCDKNGVPIGFVTGSPAVMGRIRYMVSYMALPQDVEHTVPPFRVMSRNPGIGKNYINAMAGYHRETGSGTVNVFQTPNAMPRYYRTKIFYCPAYRKCLHLLALMHSAKHPTKISKAQHDRLLTKLQRKF